MIEKENGITWAWFFLLLAKDLQMGDGIRVVYNLIPKKKGLVDVVKNYIPRGEHRLCVRHVWANLGKKYRGMQFGKHFWAILKSTTQVDFQKNIKLMIDPDPDA